jgi:Alpha-galactosidase
MGRNLGSEVRSKGGATTLAAQTNLGFKSVLLPGEKVRTGLVVMLNYDGRDENTSVNKWRAWFMKYNLPKADAHGNELKPFSTSCFAGDTGLPSTDGSISETYFTWQRTLTKLKYENFLPDFRWFDAGWYSDPAGNTVPYDGNWWATIGSWELDKRKWPGKTFLESNEACHALGLKVFVWFEPERVTDVENLSKNYGYKPEWGVRSEHCITSNLGDPECLAWTLGRITKMMGENGVDMYREDNNSDPAGSWAILDARDVEKYGLPRAGINENKCIQGHYALWDGIIEFCRRNGKCTFLDSCASGGGRNDIESLRRSVPVMRSDYDRTTTAMRLFQSSGFNKWIPFHGSSTKETEGQLDAQPVSPDLYITRASLLPIWSVGGEFSHNPNLNFDDLRRNRGIWKQNNHLLTKNFYELSQWRNLDDRTGWKVLAYSNPETEESILLGFRMEECGQDTYTVAIPFVDAESVYVLSDDDSGRTWKATGKELAEGLTLTLHEKKTSLLYHINKTE